MWHTRFGYTLLLLIALLPALFARAETESTPDSEFPPAIAELTLESHGYRVPALIYLANGKGPHPTLVLLHGFPGNEKNLDVAQSLRRDGFNVFFFHYRGAWGAEGDYSIISQPQDVASALAFLRSPDNAEQFRVDPNKMSLLGHSMVGYSALAAGSRDSDLVCVGAMSPGNVGQFKLAIEDGQPSGEWLLNYADSLFMLRGFSGEKLRQELLKAPLEDVDLRAFGPGLKGKSIFLVNGDKDTVTPADAMFMPLVEAYRRVPGLNLEEHVISGDHSFSWSRLKLTALIRDWMHRECR